MEQVYTIKELAEKLEVTERTISEALRAGDLKGYKKWRKWYVTHTQLLEFIKKEK